MRSTREALLCNTTLGPYPALPPLDLHQSSEVDQEVIQNITLTMYFPGCGVERDEGTCTYVNFLKKLRSHRYEEVVVPEDDKHEAMLKKPSGKQLLTTVLNVVNHGNILDSDIGPLTAREEDSDKGFQVVSLSASVPIWHDGQSATASDASEDGEERESNGSEEINFCDVFFLRSNSLDRDSWITQIKEHCAIPGTQPGAVSLEIVRQHELQGAAYAVVTDGVLTLVAHYSEERSATYLCIEFLEQEPLQMVVAWLITRKAQYENFCALMGGYWWFDYYLGALNKPTLPLVDDDEILARHSRSQFDIYVMQRDRRSYDQFVTWNTVKSTEAQTQRRMQDPTLVCVGNLSDLELSVHRSPVPFPSIPEETRLRLGCDVFRPFDAIAGQLQDRSFVFRIDRTLRAVDNSYSQVFTGHAEMSGSVRSGTLCLKLYDERLFPTPQFDPPKDEFSDGSKKPTRLNAMEWTTAMDMARREEAAYYRLREYQGSLVPYSYGFYWFRLTGGHRCIGMLLEYIEGQSLDSISSSLYASEERIETLVTDIRHAVRVLRYAQINQRDWNLGNFLCRPVSPENAETDTATVAPIGQQNRVFSLVLIDFAFTKQHMLLDPTWLSDDLDVCWMRAISRLDGAKGAWWFAPDENEY